MTTRPAPVTTTTTPGPRGAPLLGMLVPMRRDMLGTLERTWRAYGDVTRFSVGPLQIYQVCSPSGIKHVLQDRSVAYRKSRAFDKLAEVVGQGLFTSEGDTWLRQRRLMQPAFHRTEIEGFAAAMVEETAAVTDRWSARAHAAETFDVAHDMMDLTLRVVTRTLFGTGLTYAESDTVARVLPPLLHTLVARTNTPFDVLERLPTPANRRFAAHRRALDDIVYRVIEERRGSTEERHDLLGMLMAARDADTGAGMTDAQVRDEAMTIFLAGHETTANLLSWAWVLLARHPEARERLEAEVDARLGDRLPTAADARELPFTSRVVQETLRLYPSAWGTGRRTIEPDVIDGHPVPADRNVILNFYLLHRHPDLWPDPERFDPDRFLPERSAGRPRSAYLPFGTGPRMCIGSAFATMEAVLVLATICRRYRVELASDGPIAAEATLTLRPRGGVRVRVRARGDGHPPASRRESASPAAARAPKAR